MELTSFCLAASEDNTDPFPSKYRHAGAEFGIPDRNIVVLMATASGCSAARNFFIPILAEEFQKSTNSDTIQDVYERVSRRMADDEKFGCDQVPIIISSLDRKLCLKSFESFELKC